MAAPECCCASIQWRSSTCHGQSSKAELCVVAPSFSYPHLPALFSSTVSVCVCVCAPADRRAPDLISPPARSSRVACAFPHRVHARVACPPPCPTYALFISLLNFFFFEGSPGGHTHTLSLAPPPPLPPFPLGAGHTYRRKNFPLLPFTGCGFPFPSAPADWIVLGLNLCCCCSCCFSSTISRIFTT